MLSKSFVAKSCAMAAGALLLGAASTAQASLIGQTIGCSVENLGRAYTCNVLSPVVGAGPEFDLNAGFDDPSFIVDFGEDTNDRTTILITQSFPGFSTNPPFSDFAVTFEELIWLLPTGGPDPDSEITGFSLVTNGSGVTNSDVSFTEDSLRIDYSGTNNSQGSTVLITLATNHNPFDVPEPGALALFGLGLAGIGYIRRRRSA